MRIRRIDTEDVIRMTGGTPCDACGNQHASERYRGDDLCSGCAAMARAQDAEHA